MLGIYQVYKSILEDWSYNPLFCLKIGFTVMAVMLSNNLINILCIRTLNIENCCTLMFWRLFRRYEVRVEACTLLGCAASDWSSVQTLESPPTGQSAPLLELQTNTKGIQTVFLVSWSPPAEPNGKLLHYELYRKQISDTESRSTATLVYRNSSTSCHDDKLLPYTAYEYQVIRLFFIPFI